MRYPRVYLTMDNCFAIKRWVRPSTWMEAVRQTGARYIEASTDNECDPLFATPEYLADWAEEVLAGERRWGLKVANFYTGYQTYRTVGLAHHDPRIREHLLNGWLKPAVRLARRLRAGLGFCFFAMPDAALQSPEEYARTEAIIMEALGRLVRYAWEEEPVPISFEQMYAPHQPPWTIGGAKEYLRRLYAECGKPAYVTVDVGHQVGQRRFLRPTAEKLEELLRRCRAGGSLENVWLGPASAYALFERAKEAPASADGRAIEEMQREMDRYPYLFAEERDGDTYAWLEEVGCYSPIIHMQQNNGITSHHAPFTAENNRDGIVRGTQLLQALARSYEREPEAGLPPKVEEIYLSFEIFAGNTDYNTDTLRRLQESVRFWRRFVPRDGARLDELLAAL